MECPGAHHRPQRGRSSRVVLHWIIAAAVNAAIALLPACDQPSCSTNATGEPGPAPAAQELRLVSLSPALTRMAVDLGLEGAIVGRSSFDTAVDESVPPVGDLLNADVERIIKLNPTHVLIQEPASGGDGLLHQMAEREGWTLGAWRSIDRLADVERVLTEMADLVMQHPAADEDAIRQRRDALLAAMDEAASPSSRQTGSMDDPGAVLIVYQTGEPIGVFGRATYLDDLLAAAGATNATEATGWANLSLEDVVRIDPGSVILVRPGAPADADPMDHLGRLKELPIAAVEDGRVAILRHEDALLPSTSLPDVGRDLRRCLAELADSTSDEAAAETANDHAEGAK